MRPEERTLDPERCLGATPFIEAEAPAILEAARRCVGSAITEPARAAALLAIVFRYLVCGPLRTMSRCPILNSSTFRRDS